MLGLRVGDMTAPVADLILRSERGDPIVVVEAKGRPIPQLFSEIRRLQIEMSVRDTRSTWSLLIDPVSARIEQHTGSTAERVQIPTAEILSAAGLSDTDVVGRQVLLLAAERWLRSLRTSSTFVRRYPGLIHLAQEIEHADRLSAELL